MKARALTASMWTFSNSDALRVSRDLAYAELSQIPGVRQQLGPRLTNDLAWGKNALDVDSLSRMALATAAATWCNAHDSGHSDLFLARKNVADWAQVMLQARSQTAQNFTFSTSGSTGARKHIRHKEAHLWQEVQGWAELLKVRKRVVVCCPVHHIYGFLWGVMLPQAIGVPVVELAWDAPLDLQPGDLLVAVPAQWSWWGQIRKPWPADIVGVTSTAPLSAEAAAAAKAQGLRQLLAIYGSTETAGLGWRDELDAGTSGQGYTLGPARARMGDGIGMVMADGALVGLDVQDHLQWLESGQFMVTGRIDGVLQIAGHNVSTEAVRLKLVGHQDVSEAAVRLDLASPAPRLKAFVVLKEGATPANFERWLHDQLDSYSRPARVAYGSALPRNDLGKLTDW